MKNNYQKDVICTIGDHGAKLFWRSTDGYIYRNAERLEKRAALDCVTNMPACFRCPANQTCLEQLQKFGRISDEPNK